MHATTNDDHSKPDNRLAHYPALAALRLDQLDMDALVCQGFVCREKRDERVYFKLRFRRAGRQIVRYIGDDRRAAAIQKEMRELQADVRIMRQLKAIATAANQRLRQAKKELEPILNANGFTFHGLAIRRRR